jgi:hypothetical protein
MKLYSALYDYYILDSFFAISLALESVMIVPLRSLIVYITIDINRSHRTLALRYKQILRCF